MAFNLPAEEAEEAGVRVAFVLEMPEMIHGLQLTSTGG